MNDTICTEWVHYSDLKVGDIVREGNTNFRVVASPRKFYVPGGQSGWNVQTVAADNNVDRYYHPFVKKAGDPWSLQYREDLAYTHRVRTKDVPRVDVPRVDRYGFRPYTCPDCKAMGDACGKRH